MNRIIYLSFLILLACSGNSQEASVQEEGGITLSGTVGFPQQGEIVLERLATGRTFETVDTIQLKEDYTFSHQVEVRNPGYYRLNFYNQQLVVVILNKDDLTINVDGNSRNGFNEVKGSSEHDLIREVQSLRQSFQSSEEVADINQRFAAANREGRMEDVEKIRDEYFALSSENDEKIAETILNAGPSIAAIDLLNSKVISSDNYFHVYDQVASSMIREYPDLASAVAFNDKVNAMRKLSVGQVAPEIELPNPDGEIVSLSDQRGKYVLIDFWAKWCKPCRVENPNIVRAYNKYKSKGFDVFGVSLDKNKSDWVQAIREDGLTWTHVSDLKFWNSEAAKLYGVSAIPFSVLVDPEGKIIAKNLRGAALDSKLSELLD